MRLRARLNALFAVLAVSTAILLILMLDGMLRRAVEDRVLERIDREIAHAAEDIKRVAGPDEDAYLRRTAQELATRITVIEPDGRVSHDTDLLPADVPRMENHGNRPEVREARAGGAGVSYRFSATEQENRIYVARQIPGGEVLRFSVPAARVRETESAYLWSARLAICGACLIFFLIGSAASRRFSEPIAVLTRAASAIAAGEPGRALPSSGSADVSLLANSLQRLKQSLENASQDARSERRLSAMVLEQLPDGLLVLDSRLQVVEANRRFSEMTGIGSPVGRPLYDLLRHREVYEIFEATLRTGAVGERTIVLSDEVVWQVTVVPLPAGSRGAVVGVLRDVTRFERAEAMRRRFVADVSHELRTPIASMAAAAETLAAGDADESERAELVEVVGRQADRMAELIGDLMDLSQIESGGVELRREDVLLSPLFEEVARELAPEAGRRGIKVDIRATDSVTVFADRRRLGQIVRNLADNAIKFSPEQGTVTLRAAREDGQTFLAVDDEGPGIPRSEREKIFQRFYQVDRSRSKTRPGSGLGLAIVKHLVQLHGGEVSVQSEPGRGSTFRVTLPSRG
jgi:two-component system phosphate regulon sensor histidine kinase PhoR